MRFIFNFILFGLLFYVIWWNFPEQFKVLQSWAAAAVDMIIQVFHSIMQKFDVSNTPAAPK